MPSNTARILKNSLMLYFRQTVIMLVSLYTVRVVLNTLGVEDYGIYNVVSGVVVMFSFLNTVMLNAIQRFMNFALGQDNIEQARDVFSVSLVISILIAVLVLILAETVGLWVFYVILKIPPDRQTAAFAVYQFSVATMIVNFLRVPYQATVIAYEKMSFFALMSIVEGLLKLCFTFLLSIILYDKLMIYALFICIISIIIFFVNKVYCNIMFETTHFRYCKDKLLFQKISMFSGWNAFGGFADIGRIHGTNILLNYFYGVTMNATFGIVMQVNTAINQFISNIQTAYRPQIVKSYSAKNFDHFMLLIFQVSKVSFYFLLFFALPLFINAEFILQFWLKNIPQYTVEFTRLIVLFSLLDTFIGPLWMSMQATGDVKKYQLITSCFVFANIPLSFLFLWLGFNPVWVFIIRIGVVFFSIIWHIFFLNIKICLPIKHFLREVILPTLVITGFSGSTTIYVSAFFGGWSKLLVSCIVSSISIICLIYIAGLNKQEKIALKAWIIDKKHF
ncbi:MAG: hypothetical protein LBH43_06415 [Treponema sp.]|nr:hypothetical protein [Treponema sp.]